MILETLLILAGTAFGNIYRITNESGFATFVNNVNSGTGYYDTTVYLDSDLSFTGYSLDPIGIRTEYSFYNKFYGVFNGQGHVISNLVISSSLVYVGLFGYSEGLTIKNIVLDSSCSVTSFYSGDYDSLFENAHVGGIVACSEWGNIENCVNMAKISFNGNTDNNLFIGGIVGAFCSLVDYDFTIKNCANYGSIVHSGRCDYSDLGGIAGDSSNFSFLSIITIINCINYGTIIHSGSSEGTSLGGIVGISFFNTKIKNCVSAGKITISRDPSGGTSHVGSILGNIGIIYTHISDSYIHINYCYFTSNVGINRIYGKIILFHQVQQDLPLPQLM